MERLLIGVLAFVTATSARADVNELLRVSGLTGGVACVVGDEAKALALAQGGGWIVLALDPDAANVAKLKEKAAAAGIFGRSLYVEEGTADRLPFADNLVDLVVSPEATPEVLRVLSPERGRVICGGKVVTKPESQGSDDWTHRMHGPDNNPVSGDTAFRMPAMIQYLGMPMQTSFQGSMLVEGGRRIELSDWVSKKPDRNLVAGKMLARSLYNGQILWERALPEKIEPDTPIVALASGRVYLAADDACRVLVIDAETGRDLPSIAFGDAAQRVKWLAVENGRLYALTGDILPVRPPLSSVINREMQLQQTASGQTIVAVDLNTGRELWRHVAGATIDYHTIAVRAGRTYFYSEKTCLGSLDPTGKLAWENRDAAWMAELKRGPLRNSNVAGVSTLRVGDGQVWLTIPGVNKGFMFGAADGKFLWQGRTAATDFFVADRFYTSGGAADPLTGKVVEPGHFSIGGWCGVRTWVPVLKSGLGHVAFGLRSPCGVGIYAAGGVVCVMPSQCDCWPSLRGAGGVVSAGHVFEQVKESPQHPLETGSAPAGKLQSATGDWPQYRGDVRRTGAATIAIGTTAQVRWVAKPDRPFPVPAGHELHRMEWLDRATPPVTAGGLVFTATSDGSVRAVRIADGQLAWTFWTGGAVLTAPAVSGGRVYAGSADGWLYCLDAATGQLAWRWRGAPAERRIMVYGKLMSSWPLTTVLVDAGIVYGVAGQWMQNGTVTFALDAATGRERWTHWTEGDNNHFLDPYLKRDDPAFSPAGALALVGKNLWIRDYLGMPAIFETSTGRRVPVTEDMVKFQKTYWNFGVWFATAGQDMLVVNDRLVLQGGYPLLGNPDIRHDKAGAKFVALRVNDQGQIQALPHPPKAIPNSQIAPALAGDELLVVGGRSGRGASATTGLSLWALDAWQSEFPALVDGDGGKDAAADRPEAPGRTGAASDDPFKKRPEGRNSLDMGKARWSVDGVEVNAVVLGADAAAAVVGVPAPVDRPQYGVHPGFTRWELVAFERATGKKRWAVELPGEPVFNGLAPAADGSWLVTLRDGSVVVVK